MSKRKTDAGFKKEIYDLIGDEYTFLDNYVNAITKLKVKHNKCGNVYKVAPNKFLCGRRCPYCNGGIIKTNKQFKKEVFDLVGNEYEFLDTYINDKTKLRVKHSICGSVYKVRPNNFFNGARCPHCSVNAKTNEQFSDEVNRLGHGEYALISNYVNNHTKVRIRHNKCGSIYEVTPNHFIQGRRCPYCLGTPKKTDTQFKREVYALVGSEYTFLDRYVNNATKLRVKHNKCGQVYKVRPLSFLSNHNRCPYCVRSKVINKLTKTNQQFQKEVHDLVGNEYVFLDDYINTHTKIRVKHSKCGKVYTVRPRSFFEGYRCPYCNSSKGEVIINKILKSLGIKYEYQKTFDDLKDAQPLSYDFYIPSQSILIEYQGKQHYEPVDYFGGETKFKLQQKHDHMKANYAKIHHYNLIAIPYTVDTFSKIKKYLIKHGLKKQ